MTQAIAGTAEPRGRPARRRAALAHYATHLPVREETVHAGVAAIAGYFAEQAWREPIPGLPRRRQVQRCQLRASLAWCARRLQLPAPGWLAALQP